MQVFLAFSILYAIFSCLSSILQEFLAIIVKKGGDFMLRLRELRIEREFTQEKMANVFQISRQVYANYENSINQPSIEMLIFMADYFQCSVDYLLGRSDDFGNVTVKEKNSPELTSEEQSLLNDFRSLPRQERVQATEYVHYLADKRGNQNKNA